MLWLFDSSNTHFFSTFHYHNNWGATCILSLCSGLALSNYHLRRRHPEKSNNPWLFFLIMSMFLLATLPLARGRVSICAGIIILLALLIWALRRWKGLGSIFKNLGTSYPRKIGILIGVSALITFLWNILRKDPVLERLQDTEVQVASFLNDNGNYRTWGWQHTPRMALDRPYWGWGLGSYKWVFNQEYAGSEFQKYSKNRPCIWALLNICRVTSQGLMNSSPYLIDLLRVLIFLRASLIVFIIIVLFVLSGIHFMKHGTIILQR